MLAAAIISGVSTIFDGVVDLVGMNHDKRYGRLPDWLEIKDFQRKDYTVEIVIGAMALIMIIAIISISRAK